VEAQNYLGIYISRTSASVVYLGQQGGQGKVLGCFRVSLPKQQNEAKGISAVTELTNLVSEGCNQRQWKFSEVAVALDCSMFMQHRIHSEFQDVRRIAQTVRFDTEEVLSMDVSNIAVAFEVLSGSEEGSELNVFTARQEYLSELIRSLQSNKLDPATIEPDIKCLSRFLKSNDGFSKGARTLFGMLSASNGYFIDFSESGKNPNLRSFLMGQRQDRAAILRREIPLTLGLIQDEGPSVKIKVFDSTGSTDYQQLSENIGFEVQVAKPSDLAGTTSQMLADCEDQVAFTVAYGAALVLFDKDWAVSFRDDFMPYQGRKLRIQKAVRFLSISVCILLTALGIYLSSQLLRINGDRNEVRKRFGPDYSDITLGGNLPDSMEQAVSKLGRIKTGIEKKKSGVIADEQAVMAKLRLVLEAFNKCAKQTDLKIERISVNPKNIRVTGNTANERSTLKLLDTIRENMSTSHYNYGEDHGRSGFNVTIVSKDSVSGGRLR